MSEVLGSCGSAVEEPPQKRRRSVVDWRVIQSFSDTPSFKIWLDNKIEAEQIVKGPLLSTEDGDRRHWRCTFSNRKGWQSCPYKLLAFFPRASTDVEVSWNGQNHSHIKLSGTPAQPASGPCPVHNVARGCIEKGLNEGLKPTQIMRKLRCEKFPVPSKKQLDNIIAYIRRKQGASGGYTTADLTSWVDLHSAIPSDPDTAFVTDHFLTVEEGLQARGTFGVVITTPRLIQALGEETLGKNGCLHIDATYKLMWQGFPVLVVAVSDRDRKTIPIAISINTKEDGNAFTFLLKALQQAVEKVAGHKYCPSLVMADAAPAITVAVRRVFGPTCKRGMCWAHTIRNVDKEIDRIPNKEYQDILREDIRLLQLAPAQADFQQATTLWYNWLSGREDLLQFRDYFWQQWMGDLNGWYEGFSSIHPSTNNGLEAINKVLKDSYTLRDRLPLPRFLDTAKTAVEHWSFTLRTEGFSSERTIHLSEWTQAWQWQQGRPPVKHLEGTSIYFVPAASTASEADLERLANAYFQCIVQGNYGSWENYKRLRTAAWIVGDTEDPNMLVPVCTCPVFLKKRLCKHSLGLQIMRGHIEVPVQAKAVPLG